MVHSLLGHIDRVHERRVNTGIERFERFIGSSPIYLFFAFEFHESFDIEELLASFIDSVLLEMFLNLGGNVRHDSLVIGIIILMELEKQDHSEISDINSVKTSKNEILSSLGRSFVYGIFKTKANAKFKPILKII